MNCARWIVLAFLVSGSLCSGAAAQPTSPATAGVMVRVTLDPSGDVVIGQQAYLMIDVLFPGEMPFPPRVGVPVVPGAQTARLETQALTLRERINGNDYVGKRFAIAIYPRRGGDLSIPSVPITLLDKAENATGIIESPPARLHIIVPPGIDESRPVVASPSVTMTETWLPAPDSHFRVGQALQRTIVRRADGVLGLAFGALGLSTPRGVHAYVDQPRIDDHSERGGEVTGHRLDHVTYAFEAAGTYTIPAVTQQWWDLDDKNAQTIELPQRTLVVVAEPVPASRRSALLGALTRPMLWAVGFPLIAVSIVVWLMWPTLRREWDAWRVRRAASERTAFRALRRAAATGSAPDTYRAFSAWRRHIAGQPVAEFAEWQDRLDRALFGTMAHYNWSREHGQELVRAVARARRRGLHRKHRRHLASLPPLNPPIVRA